MLCVLQFIDFEYIQAIIEDVNIKKPFYKELGEIVKPSGILASNTSSLAISDFAGSSGRASQVVCPMHNNSKPYYTIAWTNPYQFQVGLHFFNPVQLMKLVEVVETKDTDPAIFELCKKWVHTLGKTPVSCKDTPGFIVNRYA